PPIPFSSVAFGHHPLAPEVDPAKHDQNGQDDAGRTDPPVPVERVGSRLAAVVGKQRHAGCPADPAGGVPEEEPPPRHPAEAGHPRRREPEDRDEAREEDGLASVLLEEALGGRDDALGEALDPFPPPQDLPSPTPRNPVAAVV